MAHPNDFIKRQNFYLRMFTPTHIRAGVGLTFLALVGLFLQFKFAGGSAAEIFSNEVIQKGSLGRAAVYSGEWYRIITGPLFHASFSHFFGNLWGILIFGTYVRSAFSIIKTWTIFLSAIFLGAAFCLTFQESMSCVGISGGVFGLIGAYLYSLYFQSRNKKEFRKESRSWFFLEILVVFKYFLVSWSQPDISLAAHIGGFIGGVVAAFWIESEDPFMQWGPVAAALVLCVFASATLRIHPKIRSDLLDRKALIEFENDTKNFRENEMSISNVNDDLEKDFENKKIKIEKFVEKLSQLESLESSKEEHLKDQFKLYELSRFAQPYANVLAIVQLNLLQLVTRRLNALSIQASRVQSGISTDNLTNAFAISSYLAQIDENFEKSIQHLNAIQVAETADGLAPELVKLMKAFDQKIAAIEKNHAEVRSRLETYYRMDVNHLGVVAAQITRDFMLAESKPSPSRSLLQAQSFQLILALQKGVRAAKEISAIDRRAPLSLSQGFYESAQYIQAALFTVSLNELIFEDKEMSWSTNEVAVNLSKVNDLKARAEHLAASYRDSWSSNLRMPSSFVKTTSLTYANKIKNFEDRMVLHENAILNPSQKRAYIQFVKSTSS